MRRTYRDDDLEPIEPQLGPGEKVHVPVFHDESIFRANDLRRRVYVRDGRMPLRKKGQGRAVHVSDFIIEQTGRLTLSASQIEENTQLPVTEQLQVTDAREIIYPGKNHDGFWTNDKLVEQVRSRTYCVRNQLTVALIDKADHSHLRADVSGCSCRVRV